MRPALRPVDSDFLGGGKAVPVRIEGIDKIFLGIDCLPGKQSCSGHLVLTRLQSALELKRIFVINMWHDFPGCFSSS